MIKCISAELTYGDERRWHRARLDFVCDDEGRERLERMIRDEFEIFNNTTIVRSNEKALPVGPIEGELIEGDE